MCSGKYVTTQLVLFLLGIILKGPMSSNASRLPQASNEGSLSDTEQSSANKEHGRHSGHQQRHQPTAPTSAYGQSTNALLDLLNEDTGSNTVDPLCAVDANPFADCLPSNTKALKNFSKGTKQHISICLKFHQGLRCVTQYADRCFPPGTSDFLIPLNRSYTRSCSHLRPGEDIIGERCYRELTPKWDECVRTLRHHAPKADPFSASMGGKGVERTNGSPSTEVASRPSEHRPAAEASDDAVLTEESMDQSGSPFGFGGGNRCCDRYRALKCVYDAARTMEACSSAAVVRAIQATDLMSRDYLPEDCSKTDPSNCYFPSTSSSASSVSRNLKSWTKQITRGGQLSSSRDPLSNFLLHCRSFFTCYLWILIPTCFSLTVRYICSLPLRASVVQSTQRAMGVCLTPHELVSTTGFAPGLCDKWHVDVARQVAPRWNPAYCSG